MANLKITDVLPRYNGLSDISTWLKQAELAKDMLKLDSLVTVIPMFLDKDAFTTYDHMSTDDKKDIEKIKTALIKTFAIDVYSAYEQLASRSWAGGESVNSYLADLKRLAKLAGVGQNDGDTLLKLSFVTGLPKHVAAQIRATPKLGGMDICEILGVAKALMTDYGTGKYDVGAAVTPAKDSVIRCFICGGPHVKRFCPQARQIVCYSCGDVGHKAWNCQKRKKQGNGSGMPHAPARVPGTEEAQL